MENPIKQFFKKATELAKANGGMNKIAGQIGYDPSSFSSARSRNVLSSEMYSRLCRVFPSLKGTVPEDLLVQGGRKPGKTNFRSQAKKKKKVETQVPEVKSARPQEKLCLDVLEASVLLGRHARKPESASLIEALEALCNHGIGLPRIIGAMKAEQEVVRGR
jgi:hypothetical protein